MIDKEQSNFRSWIRSLVVLMAFTMPSYAQHLPKMVLCITVDQLRDDYLQELKPILSDNGINRIIKEGKVYRNLKSNYLNNNRASALSSIFTGYPPSINGIDFPSRFDSKTLKQENIFIDNTANGVYAKEGLSPKALKVPTIGDILKGENRCYTIVYSVAPYAEEAIVAGGYLANGVFWIDDSIGSWGSSSYYGEMPWYISTYNKSKDGPNQRLVQAKEHWTISDDNIIGFLKDRGFSATKFAYQYNSTRIPSYKSSRLANDEVTKLATQIISNAGYSDSKTIGMLSVTLDASIYPYANDKGLNAETADKYVGIDKNIKDILNSVDKTVGLNNCLVTLCSTGYFTSNNEALKPKDTELIFDTAKAEAIINMYLVAIYGQGKWVTMLKDGALTLNPKLIKDKGIKIKEIEKVTSRILKEIQGIDIVLCSEDLFSNQSLSPRETLFANGIYPQKDGINKGINIYWTLKKGYTTSNKNVDINVNQDNTAIPSIFVVMGQTSRVEDIPFEVYTTADIARVISWVMRIRPPNYMY